LEGTYRFAVKVVYAKERSEMRSRYMVQLKAYTILKHVIVRVHLSASSRLRARGVFING